MNQVRKKGQLSISKSFKKRPRLTWMALFVSLLVFGGGSGFVVYMLWADAVAFLNVVHAWKIIAGFLGFTYGIFIFYFTIPFTQTQLGHVIRFIVPILTFLLPLGLLLYNGLYEVSSEQVLLLVSIVLGLALGALAVFSAMFFLQLKQVNSVETSNTL